MRPARLKAIGLVGVQLDAGGQQRAVHCSFVNGRVAVRGLGQLGGVLGKLLVQLRGHLGELLGLGVRQARGKGCG